MINKGLRRVIVALAVALGCCALLTLDIAERTPSTSLAQAAWSWDSTPVTTTYLTYELQNGYIHNWLVAGAESKPADQTEDLADITRLPSENTSFVHDGLKMRWIYYKTLDDHFIDLMVTGDPRPAHVWAYAQVEIPSTREVILVLTAYGPTALWINGEPLSGLDIEHGSAAKHVSLPAQLNAGHNGVLLRFEIPAVSPFSVGGALQIVQTGKPEPLLVLLPTETADVALRQYYEQLLETAYLESVVDVRGNRVRVNWPTDLDLSGECEVQIQDARHRIYVEQSPYVEAGLSIDAGHPARIWEGDYFVVFRAPIAEYSYGLRYQYKLPVHIVDNAYSTEPYGTYADRRLEALQDAAKRENSAFSEIARLALGPDADPDTERLTVLVEHAAALESDVEWMGLLGLVTRLTATGTLDAPTRNAVEELLAAKLPEQPSASAGCPLLALTWRLLAGQLYPQRILDTAGNTGATLRRQSEGQLWSELKRQTAFTAGEGGCSVEANVVALAHLLDLAEEARLRELSRSALDALFMALDQYAFQGVLSSAFRRTAAPMATSHRLSDAAGISRLLWGVGVYNRHMAGTVSLAISSYEPLALAYALPSTEKAVTWTQAPLRTGRTAWQTLLNAQPQLTQALYRTPDVMLDSVSGYRPGERGADEHLWQATLGPDAVVFVNHPANLSESSDHLPNRWLGNVTLPAVAQWRETLIAIHALPEDDWLGFTHAYFPALAFDEIAFEDNWVFAQKNDGHVALTASQALTPVRTGLTAYHELRAYGQHTVWLCIVGSDATDGSFAAFRKAVLALDVTFEDLGVRMETLGGEEVSFAWGKSLRVRDGSKQP
ncbi:MAG: hypothetical protein JXR84_03920 [Anaerolineae bacterium]|nr:hypothetical protein [Anaerolineae bacterium]